MNSKTIYIYVKKWLLLPPIISIFLNMKTQKKIICDLLYLLNYLIIFRDTYILLGKTNNLFDKLTGNRTRDYQIEESISRVKQEIPSNIQGILLKIKALLIQN